MPAHPEHQPGPRREENAFAQRLFTPLPERYDLLEELLSFGQNARWRRSAVGRAVAGDPRLVLDVATGTAGVAIQLARRSEARVVGLDLTEQMLRRGARNVTRAGLEGRIKLVVGQAERLPFGDGSFDALTFTYLLRYVADPAATLRELGRVLRPGGRMASLEFFAPPHPAARRAWWLYTRAVLPVAGRWLGGPSWQTVGRFLGPSISRHYRDYPLGWTLAAWRDAGFRDVGYRVMSLGGGLVVWGVRTDG
ncbi:MAG: class I SAM-dependent methyltransferase [Mycobacteriales bacterium]